MRKLSITNEKILKLLSVKQDLSAENVGLIKQIEALEKNYTMNISKMARADEKARPLILALMSTIKLGEFEELSRVHRDEQEGLIMEIVDRLEEFKKQFKKKWAGLK